MYQKYKVFILCLAVALTAPAIHAADSISEAIENGEVHLDFRARFESVDQELPADLSGNALTLRSRLNFKTEEYNGFTAFAEVDDVTALDDNSYNSTTNGQVGDAVITDPEGTEINQVWLEYSNWNSKFKYGRQRIILDTQRFVGGVAFRQNEQTYDGFSFTNTSLEHTQISYARINNVNRIFGQDSAAGDHETSTDLFNVKYSGSDIGTFTFYAYLIDNEDAARFSTDTYGVRFSGEAENNGTKWGYSLEYANQSDSANNPLDYEASYLLAEGTASLSGATFVLGYEVLGSDGGNAAFVTPLATLHKFQGWTDQFLATPDQGMADLYLSASTTVSGVKISAVYHNFGAVESSPAGDDNLGSELGFTLGKAFGKLGLELKYASYTAGDSFFGKSDTNKLWLTATAVY